MNRSEFNKMMKDSFGDRVVNVPSEELTLESLRINQLEKDNKNLLNAIRSKEDELDWWRTYGEYVNNFDNNIDQDAIDFSNANNLND